MQNVATEILHGEANKTSYFWSVRTTAMRDLSRDAHVFICKVLYYTVNGKLYERGTG